MENVAQKSSDTAGFSIKYPLLWLAVATVVIYLPTLSMGVTDLDDGIFINDFRDYNENLQNLFTSFHRSVFGVIKDLYYRPLFLDLMILNYQVADHGKNIAAFHLVNVALEVTAVILLYKFFIKLKIKELHSFLLTLLFAVHPVLTETVAWISARIEIMLAIFVLLFFINAISYTDTGKIKNLLLSGLYLALAFFTKETAIAAIPAAFMLLVFVRRKNWRERRSLVQYGVWIGTFAIWFAMRTLAHMHYPAVPPVEMASSFVSRLPLISQYIGKVFLPFNLSVYPMQEDTAWYYGAIATAVFVLLLFTYRQRNMGIFIAGLSIFLVFLLPSFFVPKYINQQTFEYRLYIPMIGILLLLTQTPLLQNKLEDKKLLIAGVALCGLLSVINFNYQKSFNDPVAFWTQAVETTPHSSYANMMLAARTSDPDQSKQLFLKAFALNPRERYVNYIYAVMLQDKDSVLASEKYLLAEKEITNYYKCDFYLARVAIERKELPKAITYLETYLKNDRKNDMANNNLLLLYLDTDQDEKAKQQAMSMRDNGLNVPKAVLQHFNL